MFTLSILFSLPVLAESKCEYTRLKEFGADKEIFYEGSCSLNEVSDTDVYTFDLVVGKKKIRVTHAKHQGIWAHATLN